MKYRRETAVRLADVYGLLRGHFGYADPWWPGTPFQIAVTAVLVQQCDWAAAWQAVENLPEIGVETLPDLAEADPDLLRKALGKVTFAPTKSKRLIGIAERIGQWGYESFEAFLSTDRDRETIRREALSLPGVGSETADCWLNFASAHPSFVVDAYTRRIFGRLFLVWELDELLLGPASYEEIQNFFETHLLADLSLYDDFRFPDHLPRETALLRDYHALLVELGKHHCLKRNPRCRSTGNPGWDNYAYCESHCLPGNCSACPLSSLCSYPE